MAAIDLATQDLEAGERVVQLEKGNVIPKNKVIYTHDC